MSAKSDFLEVNILNHVLRGISYSSPASVYAALYTVAPTDVGTDGTEVSGGAYVRQQAIFGAPGTPAPNQVTNNADITFPIATADWGTIVAFSLMDAPSGGNMLYHASLTASRTILTGDQFRFPTGQLIVGED